MTQEPAQNTMEPLRRVSVTDQVFQELHGRVLSLALPPGSKISEAEIAKQLQVSRQVVRDAFFRLSRLGFLIIRPQKATVVSRISAREVFEARYIRSAIEVENIRHACNKLTEQDFDELEGLLTAQQDAIERDIHEDFHRLDNAFHKRICEMAGFAFTWDVIQEQKAHTDRVRFLSIAFSSYKALEGHRDILKALRLRDAEMAAAALRDHLSQIEAAVQVLKESNHEWFDMDR